MGPRFGVRRGGPRAGAAGGHGRRPSSPYDARCRSSDGTLRVAGLADRVQVLRDEHGIPQVYADNSADLFYAQGFVQAQDRFFEMDFRRHVTAGRISELLGKATVETDLFIRTMGWRRVAAREYDLLEPSTRAYLDAYSDGVNAYLAGKSATSAVRGVHRARPGRPRLQAGEVDAGRLAGLAEGDGVGPARQHGRRDRAHPALARPVAGAGRRALPARTPTTGTRRSSTPRPASGPVPRRDRRSGRRRWTRSRPYDAASTRSPT